MGVCVCTGDNRVRTYYTVFLVGTGQSYDEGFVRFDAVSSGTRHRSSSFFGPKISGAIDINSAMISRCAKNGL